MGAYLSNSKKFVQDRIEQLFDSFPILRDRRNQLAGTLSGGEQQQVAIARALALNPKWSSSMNPPRPGSILVTRSKRSSLPEEEKITILLVEQNAKWLWMWPTTPMSWKQADHPAGPECRAAPGRKGGEGLFRRIKKECWELEVSRTLQGRRRMDAPVSSRSTPGPSLSRKVSSFLFIGLFFR